MRTKGSAKLTDSEWLALCKTKLEDRTEDLTSAEFLEKTNDWYHTCYLWNIVNLIAFVRVRTAAKLAAKTMFYSQAVNLPDKPLSPEQLKELLGVANLSTTSKLQGVNLFLVGQRIRLTKQVLAPWAVQDATGTIVHINFAEPLPETLAAECVVHMPKAIYVKFDSLELEFLPPRPCNQHLVFHAGCNDCISFPGVVQVTPQTDVWTYKLSDSLSIRVKRTSFPIWPEKACSLYTMQGTTTTPGMVAHFDMPRMTPPDLHFLTVYVLLSRVRRPSELITVNLTDKVRTIIESGPPGELLETFETLFGERATATRQEAEEACKQLGWTKCQAPWCTVPYRTVCPKRNAAMVPKKALFLRDVVLCKKWFCLMSCCFLMILLIWCTIATRFPGCAMPKATCFMEQPWGIVPAILGSRESRSQLGRLGHSRGVQTSCCTLIGGKVFLWHVFFFGIEFLVKIQESLRCRGTISKTTKHGESLFWVWLWHEKI